MGAFKDIYTEHDVSDDILIKNVVPITVEKFDSPEEQISFLGDIQCGFPSPAQDYIEQGLNLHDLVVKKPAATYFMRAKGDSMKDVGIYPDDILVIDRSIKPVSGHIVVASLNGEMTLKRLSYHTGKPVLMAENSKYKIISVSEHDDFQVFGVLTHNLHVHL